MAYKPNDFYARKAKAENYAARSVYKLEEINKKYRLFHKGDYVLDLGCSPGSWSQYVSKIIGREGKIFGIDLKKTATELPNAYFAEGDIEQFDFKTAFERAGIHRLFDHVVSDMAPNTSSNRFTDQVRSYELCLSAFETARKYLKAGGNFVCKIFDGPDAMTFVKEIKKHFERAAIHRPESTRKSSKEIFLIGRGFKP